MRKIISIVLAVLMLASNFNIVRANEILQSIDPQLIKSEGEYFGFLNYPSSGHPRIYTKIDYYIDSVTGEKVLVYCRDPLKQGASEVGSYLVKFDESLTDPIIYHILENGYPMKTPAEMGLKSEQEAYYVTKMALDMNSTFKNQDSWTVVADSSAGTSGAVMLQKVKDLLKLAKDSGAITQKSSFSVTPTNAVAVSNGDNFEYTYTANGSDFAVSFDGNNFNGKITDINGNPKSTFTNGEKFKIIVPKANAGTNGSVKIKLTGSKISSYTFEGGNPVENTPYQGYWSTKKDKDISSGEAPETSATMTWSETPAQKGKLEIYKYEHGTKTPLSGAEFKVVSATSGVVGIFATDTSGKIAFDLPVLGAYWIEEVKAPKGYVLDTTPHKDVVIFDDKPTIVTFFNKKEARLELMKVDALTNKPLAGATIRVALDGGSESFDVTTDSTGKATLEGLKEGTYVVTEIISPAGYVLNSTPQNIKLVSGQTAKMTLKNKSKGKLILEKYDEKTSELLDGAEFSLAKKGGSIQWQGVVKDGKITFDNLDEGWYTITEIAPPFGYLITTKSKDIYIEDGITKQLKFDNRPAPKLEILKIDEATKQPLQGAKFRVTETESKTVSEYITDKDGKILIDNLLEKIYTIEEIVAPDGYIIETQHKDIQLEWGKTKTVIFTNKAKPRLEILKIDSVTKKPIPDTKFKIEKVEDKTVSEYTTDKDGKIVLEKLDEAIYKITETIPADGYILNGTPKEIALEWGKTKQLIFENTKKPTLIITKINGLTNKPIPNTTYKIEWESPNGGLVSLGTFITNENGQIVISKVNTGWYVITETIPAQGMSKPSNPVRRVFLSAGENAYLSEDTTTGTENTITPSSSQASEITVKSGNDFKATGEEIINYPLNSIVLKKAHAITGEMLAGAVFELRQVTNDISGGSGTIIGRYTTDNSGIVVITGLEAGGYIAEEVQAPQNFLLSENSKQQAWLRADGTSIVEITFANYPYGNILITKVDAKTGKPLANAKFKVTDGTGAVAGNTNGEFITNENGEILVPNLKPNSYVVTEIQAPENYVVGTTPQTVNVGTDGKTYKVNFKNQPLGKLVIKKYNEVTKEPLANAEFKVTTSKGDVVGTSNSVFTTDAKGTIEIPNLQKDAYVVQETKAPTGFILEQQTKTIDIDYGQTYTLDFYNKPKSSIQIIKIDSETKEPLKDAHFNVYKKNGELIGEFVTDGNGLIILPDLEPNWYKITETKAPNGYKIDETAKDVELTSNQFLKVVFENKKLTSLIIKKTDEKSGEPLSGAKFLVEKQNGEHVGEFTTDKDGTINIPTIQPDWYIIREQKAPRNYLLDETPKTVEVKTNIPTVVTFTNKKLTSLQIKKIDENTGAPLAGAVFVIEKQNGEKIQTNENGTEWTTDAQGFINIPTLAPDYYVIREIKAPQNYILDETPKTVQVKTDSPTVVTFTNKPLSGLRIIKINSETKKPIEGVEFEINKMDGQKVQNEFRTFTFKTDKTGQIFIPNLENGYYVVTETKAVDGYFIDGEPKTVLVESGKTTLLEVENTPASGLLIIKTDAQTKKPLEGVKFEIKRADGQRVQSSILDKNQPNTENNSPNKYTTANGDISGIYLTDANGRIQLNHLAIGEYHVIEKEPLKGYELDTNVHSVTVTSGKQAILEVTNKPLAGLKIKKIDSITKEPIFGVEFMVFDSNNKVIGNFYTDDQGVIDFSAILTEGRYTLRETRPAEGYFEDTKPRTVEFIAGKVTEIVWENVPKGGQIQITKLSANDNEINGLEAGTPLEGAIFEVFAYKSGNLVDRFITGYDGKGVSKPLPLGRYIIKEAQAPQYYKLNKKELDITIEFATQIIKLEFTNESANTGVSIDKVAPKEVMPNQVIRYDIKTVRNDSTVLLTDFYWRDSLPVDAVRIDKIVTGTYNQSLKYKIMATTNKGNTMVIADNLMTTKNNVIDCSNASLGLANDEFLTSFTLYFGNVKAGFTSVEEPKVYANVLNKNFPNGYKFSNKVDIGGKYQGEWVIGNGTAVTVIYTPTPSKLPKTGN